MVLLLLIVISLLLVYWCRSYYLSECVSIYVHVLYLRIRSMWEEDLRFGRKSCPRISYNQRSDLQMSMSDISAGINFSVFGRPAVLRRLRGCVPRRPKPPFFYFLLLPLARPSSWLYLSWCVWSLSQSKSLSNSLFFLLSFFSLNASFSLSYSTFSSILSSFLPHCTPLPAINLGLFILLLQCTLQLHYSCRDATT